MNNSFLAFVALLTITYTSTAQNSVGIGTETPNPRAVLELISPTDDQEIMVPKLTTAQRTAVSFTDSLSMTENGLFANDADLDQFFFWKHPDWEAVGSRNAPGAMLQIPTFEDALYVSPANAENGQLVRLK